MTYEYTVENVQDNFGRTIVVETLYPLQIGMHVQLPLKNGGTSVCRVKEIVMYTDDAVVTVEKYERVVTYGV